MIIEENTKTYRQFMRYVLVGLISFIIEYTLFALLYKLTSIPYLVANASVYAVVFAINFTLNRQWSFQSTGNVTKQITQYLILFLFNLLVVNIGLMKVITEYMRIDPLYTKVIVMGCIVCWNFIIYKKIIYK